MNQKSSSKLLPPPLPLLHQQQPDKQNKNRTTITATVTMATSHSGGWHVPTIVERELKINRLTYKSIHPPTTPTPSSG